MENSSQKTFLGWIVAAGIVGADIGTSVFYSTGLLFPYVGYLAPLFILFVCLMMWLFRATYQEGIALSPYNGGAYVMVLRSLGRRPAVLVGALTFLSYLATASVSAMSGAYYLSSLPVLKNIPETGIVLISFIPLIFFGLLNIKGIKEPAKIVTVIAGFHFALLLIMGMWGGVYLLTHEIEWSKMVTNMPAKLSIGMILHGFGAAFLGISGFESAAQIVEELKEPINETVRKLYKAVVILVSLTAPVISFMCLAVLSAEEVTSQKDYLLSGLGFKLGGNILLTIVVVDATLTLFAATNTAYVGFIGLATTMAKQGNLPQMLLTRVSHTYKHLQGYPYIVLPFMGLSMLMAAAVAGAVGTLAKVYELAFLGVMISFSIGVVLMRNKKLRRDVEKKYLTRWLLHSGNTSLPIIPLISGIILIFAQVVLFIFTDLKARSMLLELSALIILVMAFYRWGLLENRLEKRSDLRLGLGDYSNQADLPNDLPKFVLCAGGTGARRLITLALTHLFKRFNNEPFELVVFHAEEGKDDQGFFSELIQRVASQQIAPIYGKKNFILTCKILPGEFMEGILTLRKTIDFKEVLIGHGRDPQQADVVQADLEKTLETKVTHLIY